MDLLILILFVIPTLVKSEENKTFELNANETSILQCPSFGEISNGFMVFIDNYHNYRLQITCKPGFDLSGPEILLCENGKWDSIERPRCIPRCIDPPFYIENGHVDIEGTQSEDKMYKKGAVAYYSCDPGYFLSPPASGIRVCERGIWTGANATCVKIPKCKSVDPLRNGYLILDKMDGRNIYDMGQVVRYNCNIGFTLKGTVTQKCQEDGTWTPKMQPVCFPNDDVASSCTHFPNFSNSVSKVVSGFQTFEMAIDGTELEIFCMSKYHNINSPCEPARLRCIDGVWKGTVPNCVIATECKCPPKVNLGTPFRLSSEGFETEKNCHYSINSTISYLCMPGYELDGNSILTCNTKGCWSPSEPPICKMKQRYYYLETNGGEPIIFSLATGAGVLLLLVIACLIIVCRKRKPLSRTVAIPPPVPRPDLADHASLLHPPDRLALIAFADGMQVGQSGLPTYEEATRDRLGVSSSRFQRPPWPSLVSRRPRNSPNPDNMLFTRQGSFASHTASTRSGGDPMGSTDTMAVSENSTTVTLDTASSHSGSQPASCRAHCGSLASFDTSSVLNTEGVPLLEESELEELQCGETVSLAMENRSMCDNTSYKLSSASDIA